VLSDLFFSVKLADAAKRAGLALEFVRDGNEVLEKARLKPALIVFDLNFDAAGPLDLISRLDSPRSGTRAPRTGSAPMGALTTRRTLIAC